MQARTSPGAGPGSRRVDGTRVTTGHLTGSKSVSPLVPGGSQPLSSIPEGGRQGGRVRETLQPSSSLSSVRIMSLASPRPPLATDAAWQRPGRLGSSGRTGSFGGIVDAWAIALAGQSGGAGKALPASDVRSQDGSAVGQRAAFESVSGAAGSLKGAVSSNVGTLTENVIDGPPQTRTTGAETEGMARDVASQEPSLQPAATDASEGGWDMSLAQKLEEIEQRFAFVDKPLADVGGLNVLQRPLQLLESRLEALELAAPFAAVPIRFVRGRVAAVSASHAIDLIVTNWGHLQPEWMKATRIWAGRLKALWSMRGGLKVDVFRVNADWQNSAVW